MQIDQLIKKVGTDVSGKWISIDKAHQLATLVVNECCYAFNQTRTEPSLQVYCLDRLGLANVLAGGEIHAGDGGYEESTHEKQRDFALKRAESMIESLRGQLNDATERVHILESQMYGGSTK